MMCRHCRQGVEDEILKAAAEEVASFVDTGKEASPYGRGWARVRSVERAFLPTLPPFNDAPGFLISSVPAICG